MICTKEMRDKIPTEIRQAIYCAFAADVEYATTFSAWMRMRWDIDGVDIQINNSGDAYVQEAKERFPLEYIQADIRARGLSDDEELSDDNEMRQLIFYYIRDIDWNFGRNR